MLLTTTRFGHQVVIIIAQCTKYLLQSVQPDDGIISSTNFNAKFSTGVLYRRLQTAKITDAV